MSKEGEKLCYVGGEVAPDMLVDPDLLTFSIFEDFTRTRQVVSDVKKVWYRLPNEEISSARSIWEDKDCEIVKMAAEAQKCGEVYIYVEHSVSPIDVVDAAGLVNELSRNEFTEPDDGEKADAEDGSEGDESEEESDDENREEESDEEVIEEQRHEEIYEEEDGQDGGVQSEDDNQILGEGVDDPRMVNMFAAMASEASKVLCEDTQPNEDAEEAVDSDIETEKQLPNGEYPDSAEDN